MLAKLDLGLADLYDESIPAPRSVQREHPYVSASGRLLGVVQRREPKTFRPLTYMDGQWRSKGSEEVKTTPYRLLGVVAAIDKGEPVYVVEGEKDADTLASHGIAATCNAGGAGKWTGAHAQWLTGAHVVVCRDRDAPGHRHAEKVIASLDEVAASVRLVEPAEGKDVTDHLAAGRTVAELVTVTVPSSVTEPTPPQNPVTLVRLADVTPERVDWLWPGRLPAGKLVMLDGDPSLGKSTLAITMAAHVSTGRAWPDGATCPQSDVVVMSAEDGLADTLRPRLDAAEGDAQRVHALTAITMPGPDGPVTRPPTLADVDAIHSVVASTGARLLIIDVLMAYMPSRVDAHRDQDIRAVLHRIGSMAEATGCTVLMLRHLNKAAGSGSPMYRGGGSIGIIGAARAGFLVAVDPDDEQVRVLACTKSNLGPIPPSLAYKLEPTPGSHVAHVRWIGESDHAAASLLSVHDVQEDRSERDTAVDWLREYLLSEGGQASAKDVLRAAAAQGFTKSTLHRARDRAGFETGRSGFGKGASYVWRLPTDNAPSGQQPDPASMDSTCVP